MITSILYNVAMYFVNIVYNNKLIILGLARLNMKLRFYSSNEYSSEKSLGNTRDKFTTFVVLGLPRTITKLVSPKYILHSVKIFFHS